MRRQRKRTSPKKRKNSDSGLSLGSSAGGDLSLNFSRSPSLESFARDSRNTELVVKMDDVLKNELVCKRYKLTPQTSLPQQKKRTKRATNNGKLKQPASISSIEDDEIINKNNSAVPPEQSQVAQDSPAATTHEPPLINFKISLGSDNRRLINGKLLAVGSSPDMADASSTTFSELEELEELDYEDCEDDRSVDVNLAACFDEETQQPLPWDRTVCDTSDLLEIDSWNLIFRGGQMPKCDDDETPHWLADVEREEGESDGGKVVTFRIPTKLNLVRKRKRIEAGGSESPVMKDSSPVDRNYDLVNDDQMSIFAGDQDDFDLDSFEPNLQNTNKIKTDETVAEAGCSSPCGFPPSSQKFCEQNTNRSPVFQFTDTVQISPLGNESKRDCRQSEISAQNCARSPVSPMRNEPNRDSRQNEQPLPKQHCARPSYAYVGPMKNEPNCDSRQNEQPLPSPCADMQGCTRGSTGGHNSTNRNGGAANKVPVALLNPFSVPPPNATKMQNNTLVFKPPIPTYQVICKTLNSICLLVENCKNRSCKFSHTIPSNLEEMLGNALPDDLNALTAESVQMGMSAYAGRLFQMIINCHKQARRYNDLKKMIGLMSPYRFLDLTDYIGQIIQALIDISESTFEMVLLDILMTYGRKYVSLLDTLLLFITQREDFLERLWPYVINITRERNCKVNLVVAKNIVNRCLELNNKPALQAVTTDLIKTDMVDLTKIDKEGLFAFTKKLRDFDLSLLADEVLTQYLVQGGSPLQTITQIPVDPTRTEMTKEDIVLLKNCVLQNDLNTFKKLLINYRSAVLGADILVNMLVILKQNGSSGFHVMLLRAMRDFRLSAHKEYEEVLSLLQQIAFNTLPMYDKWKDYERAAEILSELMYSIEFVLNCKCYFDEEPYKSGLTTASEKLIFMIKMLTYANSLELAFKLVQRDELQLENRSVKTFFNYKIKVVTRFIGKLVEDDQLEIQKTAMQFCLMKFNAVAQPLGLSTFYNKYLVKVLNKCVVNSSAIVTEFRESIMDYYTIIDPSNLRAVMGLVYNPVSVLELTPIYTYCCAKGIYPFQSRQDQITLCERLFDSEIQMIVHMFFMSMLRKNLAPSPVSLRVSKEHVVPREINVCKPSQPNVSMEERIRRALQDFSSLLAVDENMVIPFNAVKQYLEFLRRSR